MGRVWPNPDDPYEPQWLEDDYAKVLAYREVIIEVCPSCGTRNSDWLDDDGIPFENPAYEVETYRCHGCHQLEVVSSSIPKDAKGVRPIIVRRQQTTPSKSIEDLLYQSY